MTGTQLQQVLLALILMGIPCAVIIAWVWLYFRHEELKQGLRYPRDKR